MDYDLKALLQGGIHQGISREDYHAAPGVSKSGLDCISKSYSHYMAYLRQEYRETPALRFGRLAHKAILEPDDCRLAIVPAGINRQTKAGKEEWAAFMAECEVEGLEIVTHDEAETLRHMRDAVYTNPAGRKLLFHAGVAEGSAWWVDQPSGEVCRCRPDYLRSDGIVVDLKTTTDASREGFSKAVANYRYHVQHAFYLDGLRRYGAVGFCILAVEKDTPYGVAAWELDAEAVEIGRALYQRNLSKLAEHQVRGKWPGYSDRIERLSLPRWATRINEEGEAA